MAFNPEDGDNGFGSGRAFIPIAQEHDKANNSNDSFIETKALNL